MFVFLYIYKFWGEVTKYLVINQHSPPYTGKRILKERPGGILNTQLLGSPDLCVFSGESHHLVPFSYFVLLQKFQTDKNKEYILFCLRVDPNLRNSRIACFVLSLFNVIK